MLTDSVAWCYELGMNGYAIRQLMRENNVQVKRIAADLGFKSATISQIIHGARSNPRIRLAIAESINKQVSDLWPEQEQS